MSNIFEEAGELGISIPKSLAISVNLVNTEGLPEESKSLLLKGLETDEAFIKFKSSVDKAKSNIEAERVQLVVDDLKDRFTETLAIDNFTASLTEFFMLPENESVISGDINLTGSFKVFRGDEGLVVEVDHTLSSGKPKRVGRGRADKIMIEGVLIENSRPWNYLMAAVAIKKIGKGNSNADIKTDQIESPTNYGWNNVVSSLPASSRNYHKQNEINSNLTKEEGLQLIADYIGESLELV